MGDRAKRGWKRECEGNEEERQVGMKRKGKCEDKWEGKWVGKWESRRQRADDIEKEAGQREEGKLKRMTRGSEPFFFDQPSLADRFKRGG